MEVLPPNDVDEALFEEQLINIHIDAHSIKEVLSELSVRLETAHQQITTLQDKKEFNDINERIDKLQDQIESVASQSSRRINNAPQSMEEVIIEIKKYVLPLKGNFQNMLDDLHDLIKEENLKLIDEKIDLFRKENIEFLNKEYTSLSQHNSLLAHIQTLYDKISDLSKIQTQTIVMQEEAHSNNQYQQNITVPDDLLEKFNEIKEKIEILENKSNDDQSNLEIQKEFSELKEKVEKQQEEIKECNGTLFLLGQKFNQYQNEIEGRLNLIELSNLNAKTSNQPDNENHKGSEVDQSNILSKIIPMISGLQERQLQLESKIQEQNNLIQTLQNQASSKPTVNFVIEETNSNDIIQNEIENQILSSTERSPSKSSRDFTSRSLESINIELRKSPTQNLSIQSTPRDHQSFKELSRHLNENDLRVTDLENEIILIKASLKDIGNNENDQKIETIAELKSELDQKRVGQSQLVLSAISSSRQNNQIDSLSSSMNDQSNNNNSSKGNNIDDFTLNDFGNLSKQVQTLLVRVENLETRAPAKFETPNEDILTKNPTSKSKSPNETSQQHSRKGEKHVQFSSTSVQTFEDTEVQVAITLDTATSPAARTPNETTPNENNNYQSILNTNNNDGPLDSARFESEPESSENRAKKVELRITTPVNEDISASRTPNSLTPNSGNRVNSKQFLSDHYIELINKISNSLNETIQTVSSLSENVSTLNKKVDSFISDLQNDSNNNFNQEEFTTAIINQVRFEIEQRLVGLTPQTIQDLNNVASIGLVKSIAQNFQLSVDNIDNQITQIKEFLNSLVTRNDLDAVLDKLNNNNNAAVGGGAPGLSDTAAGTFKMRCLLCGRAASGITGMIAESEVARLLGTPPNSIGKKFSNRNSFDVNSSNNSKMVLSFAKDPMKQRNSKKMKVATLPPMENQQNSLNKTTNSA